MNYQNLGRTGLKVSTICLGTMQFGWSADAKTSHTIMNKAVDLGINFFDTADVYSRWAEPSYAGKSEEIIGEWLSTNTIKREHLILATKVRGQMSDNPTDQGLSRHHIMNSVKNSLKRLRTDYIDLYQVHSPDWETPLEETLETLTDLVRQGLVRYIGCSNYPAWLLAKSLWKSDVHHLARFDSLQPHYSLVHRAEFERELMPLCLDQGVGVIPYSPLAAGFLTGKYGRDSELPDSARAARVKERYFSEQNFTAVDTLTAIGREHNATTAQTAIAWVLANSAVSSAIIGANSVEQLEETVKGADIQLSTEEKEKLDQTTVWQS
ncbi:MAG: aldo/keto reductase [Anaerolineales bacterium]|nr:aldo/keto reductase [Anaerolineales bacterium]